MIPIGHADDHGASRNRHWNNTVPKLMSVGVRKALAPKVLRGVDMPAASVIATNSNPISVAAELPAIMKKLSQP